MAKHWFEHWYGILEARDVHIDELWDRETSFSFDDKELEYQKIAECKSAVEYFLLVERLMCDYQGEFDLYYLALWLAMYNPFGCDEVIKMVVAAIDARDEANEKRMIPRK